MKTRIAATTVLAVFIPAALLLARPGLIASAERIHASSSKSRGESIQQQIVAKERGELDSLKTGDLELFATLLADDALFVDAQGPARKGEVVKHVAEFRLVEYFMEDVRFVSLSNDSGLIAYKITEKGVSHGEEFSARVYISAVWTMRQGKWVCVFSQETAAT
jgi:hypothetical protein